MQAYVCQCVAGLGECDSAKERGEGTPAEGGRPAGAGQISCGTHGAHPASDARCCTGVRSAAALAPTLPGSLLCKECMLPWEHCLGSSEGPEVPSCQLHLGCKAPLLLACCMQCATALRSTAPDSAWHRHTQAVGILGPKSSECVPQRSNVLQLSLPAPHVQEQRSRCVQGLQQESSGAAECRAGRSLPQLILLYRSLMASPLTLDPFPVVCRVYGH